MFLQRLQSAPKNTKTMALHVPPTPGISGLDHAVVAVRDLDAAHKTYARMGFKLAPKGEHSTGSTNHNIMFEKDYLELLNVPNSNPLQSYFFEFLQQAEGLAGLALAGTDLAAAYKALHQKGFDPTRPADFSRPVTQGSQKGIAKFALTNISSYTTPGAHWFICQHLTRELVWLPELQKHPNGATGIAAVAFVADNVAYVSGVYSKLFGKLPERIEEGMKIETGGTPVAICTRVALQQKLPGLELPHRLTGPRAAALFIRVKDRQVAFKTLRDGGFSPRKLPDGSCALDASAAHGVTLVFG